MAFTNAAIRQRYFVESLNCSSIRRFEANGDTVTDSGRIAISRFKYKERRLINAPDGSGFAEVSKTIKADLLQNNVIERTCFL
ncbi:hypothetical protein D3C80_1968280 [compost metagenome]